MISLATLMKTKISIPPAATDAIARYAEARAKSRELAELVEGAEIALAIERHAAGGLPDHLYARAAGFLDGRMLAAGEIEGELK